MSSTATADVDRPEVQDVEPDRQGVALAEELVEDVLRRALTRTTERLRGPSRQRRVSTLYRMEDRGWVKGRWVEKAGERRRCYYTLTPEGRLALAAQRREWEAYASVVSRVLGGSHA